MNPDDIVSPSVVAKRLSVSNETVLRWIREGRLRAFRCGPKVIRLSWQRTLEALQENAKKPEAP